MRRGGQHSAVSILGRRTKDFSPCLKLPDIQHTVPEVFILESLSKEDESQGYFEGRILSEMLYLAGKAPKYYYFSHKDELPHLMCVFRASKCRFLHVSVHASHDQIGLRDGQLTYAEFSDILASHLRLRRLFMSACEVGNRTFVEAVSQKNNGMHSIIAPCGKIEYSAAAAIWSAFYVSVFCESETSMTHAAIKGRFEALRKLFPVDFYEAFYESTSNSWKYPD